MELAPAQALAAIVERQAVVGDRELRDAAQAAVNALGARALDLVVKSGVPPSIIGEEAWDELYRLDRPGAEAVFAARLGESELDVRWVLGISRIVRAQGGEWAREPFAALARHGDARIRRAATEALAALGGSGAAEAVIAALEKAERWDTPAAVHAAFELGRREERAIAARAIAATPPTLNAQVELLAELEKAATLPWEAGAREAILDLVRRTLAYDSEKLVGSAVRIATELGASALVEDVVGSFANPNWYRDRLSDAWLGYVKAIGPAAIEATARAVERGTGASSGAHDRAAATMAARLLGYVGADALAHAGVLVPALRHGSTTELRDAAATALGLLDPPGARDLLLEVAQTAPPELAHSAISILARLGDARVLPQALASLAPYLEGRGIERAEEAWLCGSCIRTLGRFAGSDALAALDRALAHPDMRMRRDAADALGELRDPATRPWLVPLLEDREKQVRKAAEAAIEHIAAGPPPPAAELARTRAIAKLELECQQARERASDPYWANGPYNVQRWVERAFVTALHTVRALVPDATETATAYLARAAAEVRSFQDAGPDADDEGWYSGAIDDAARMVGSA